MQTSKQSPKTKQSTTKQQDLASLILLFQEYQRRRQYQENGISRLQKSVMDKYERIAIIKRRMQYYESWHDSTNVSSTYPMELTDCYKVSASPSSSFQSLKIMKLKEDHIIHEFVRKLRESDLAITVIHNFQSFPEKFKSIESLIIKCYIQSLYPSHSQLFDSVIQPLFIELIESLKKSDDIDTKTIVKYLYHILDLNYFQSYFGQDLSIDIDNEKEEKQREKTPENEIEGKFVLKLIYSLIHHRITNIMFAPLQKVIIKIAQGDLIFNAQNKQNIYNLCLLCIDSIYECDYSSLLDIFATIFDCLHFSVLELSHSECIDIINYIIWKWIIFPIIYEPFRFGFRISYLTQWQQASCSVFIGVLKDIIMNKKQSSDSKIDQIEEYELSDKEISILRNKMKEYINIFGKKLQTFVSFQAQTQSQSTTSSSENVSNYNKIHEYNFGILHNWTMISSIELQVLHTILFSDSSSLSSSQIRTLEKFHKLTFESLDQTKLSSDSLSSKQHQQPENKTNTEESSDVDSLEILARQLTDKILNSQFRNSYMFIVGVYPQSDIYRQWQFKSAAKIIDTSSLEHLSKICKKNIHYLSKLQIHIKKAPHIFATWCHSLLKLLLNISYPVPRNTMTNTGPVIYEYDDDGNVSSNDSNTDLDDDEEQKQSSLNRKSKIKSSKMNEFESMMGYLEYRDIRNPSLLYGLSSKNSAKSADIASVYFGLQELQNIYPSTNIHWQSIIQWLSLCLTEAEKTCDSWHEASIKSLNRVLIQLSTVDKIYRIRIDHIKHCLFSTKIHYFCMYTTISFHQGIPIPNIIFNDDGVVEEKSKYIFDFFCQSIPSFLDKIVSSLPHLSKLPKAIPILLKKFINNISIEMKDHSPHGTLDHGMLRGIHHIICAAMYYILNRPLWILDDKLNQSLEILNDIKLDPYKDLGLNKCIKIRQDLWKWIGNQLHCLEFHITPSTKMQCIHEIMQSLTHHLHSHLRWQKSIQNNQFDFQSNITPKRNKKRTAISSENITVGADDIFPSLIWLIIQTQPKRLSSSLSLIEHVSESPTSGVHAYSFTLFKQAISYIEQLANDKSLKNK